MTTGLTIQPRPPRRRVVAVALPGVVAFDLSTTAQVFGHPAEEEYDYGVASPAGGSVGTSTGFSIGGTATLDVLDELTHGDTVIVPGYRPHIPPPPTVLEALRSSAVRGVRVASVCTGAFALAAAGMLDGLRATTHWQDAAELQRAYPAIEVDPGVLYVDHGLLATSAGVAAGIDLCLHLVRTDCGDHIASRIARRMVVAPHRAGGQAQYVPPGSRALALAGRASPATGTSLSATLDWARGRLDSPLTVAALARHAGVSPRQLARRFADELGAPPLKWLTHQRVNEARRLLETTNLPLDAIAGRTGLGTPTNLRRTFHATLGVSPSQYRATFTG